MRTDWSILDVHDSTEQSLNRFINQHPKAIKKITSFSNKVAYFRELNERVFCGKQQ